MKIKLPFAIFIGICITLCLIPSVFMIFFRSDEAIGNETQTQWPSVTTEEGTFNSHFLDGMGSYFETHYAFRPQLITADAKIQSALFEVSNTDAVTTGQDGWLYYSSTLHDYLGEESLSDRGMWNLSHNVALIQNYVGAMGAKFLFMVPPNKNSLYPEHMPYYYGLEASDRRNRDHLQEYLDEEGVNYLNLFELIGNEEETLYLKQDSHWNNKGAMMVYRAVLDAMDKKHDSYETIVPEYRAIHKGDLSNMIFPSDETLEEDYDYGLEPAFVYQPGPMSSDPVSVEDYRIETVNPSAEETLLMYRDSFGNTLIPIFSNAFGRGFYVKATPYPVARDIRQYEPQYVVIELVERNIRNLAKSPAIVPAPRRSIDPAGLHLAEKCEVSVEACTEDANYVMFSGTVPAELVPGHERIYLAVTMPDGSEALYEAFTITVRDELSGEENDSGFRVYLPVSQFGSIETAEAVVAGVFTEK